jgi:hypothetical protein
MLSSTKSSVVKFVLFVLTRTTTIVQNLRGRNHTKDIQIGGRKKFKEDLTETGC